MSTSPKLEALHSYQVYNDIQVFYETLKQEGKTGTLASYKGTINEFFDIIFPNKPIELLTPLDITNIEQDDLVRYRSELKLKGNSNNTINKKVRSIKSLFTKKFATKLKVYLELNLGIFNLNSLPDDSESYDNLTFEEAETLISLVPHTEKNLAEMKQLLCKLAIRTSFRLSELLKLTIDNFEVLEDEGVVLVHVDKLTEKKYKDKENPISIDLYKKISNLSNIHVPKWKGNQELLFKLSVSGVNDMMKRLLKKVKFVGDRRIVFHSFRGVAADWDYERNRDLKRVQRQLHHGNINTSVKHYMDKDKDYLNMPGILMDKEIEMDFIEDMTIEQFKLFIMSSSSKVKNEIKRFYEKECRK